MWSKGTGIPGPLDREQMLGLAAAGLLAAGLLFQRTMEIGGQNLRFCVADIFGAVLTPYLLFLLWRRRRLLSRVPHRLFYAAIVASAAMTWGIITAWASPEGPSGWALVKYAGWYILLGYLAAGVVLAATAQPRAARLFIQVFAGGVALIVFIHLVTCLAGSPWPAIFANRLYGFSGNANAFGLTALCAGLLMLTSGERLILQGRGLLAEVVTGLIFSGVIYSRSVAACGALLFALILYGTRRENRLHVAHACLFAAVICALPLVFAPGTQNFGVTVKVLALLDGSDDADQTLISRPGDGRESGGAKFAWPAWGGYFGGPDSHDVYGLSVKDRAETNREAIILWWQHPLLGNGLGKFLSIKQAEATPEKPAMIIHSVPLWLFAELGAAGFAAIAAFGLCFAVYLGRLDQRLRAAHDPRAGLTEAAHLILVAWFIMSLAHELMYQRAPWLVLGICMGAGLAAASPGHILSSERAVAGAAG